MAVPAAARPTLLAPSGANNMACNLSLRRVAKAAQGLTHSRHDTLSCNLTRILETKRTSPLQNRSSVHCNSAPPSLQGKLEYCWTAPPVAYHTHSPASFPTRRAPSPPSQRKSVLSRCHPRVGTRLAQGCSAVPLTSCARSSGDLSVRWVAPITHGPGDALLQQHY